MDISNGTGDGTDYRTGSGAPKEGGLTWTHLPDKSSHTYEDPKTPWTIWFRLRSGKIVSATYDRPVMSVALIKTGSGYKINAMTKPVEKPAKETVKVPSKLKSHAA
jgi:hypothetical protein